VTEQIPFPAGIDSCLDRISVVLVGTTHPGNIGASARAMKTMGLAHLVLVNPRRFPCAEASARATGADDVLAQARVVGSLAEALADCGFVVGASARDRHIQWPALEPRECAARLISETAVGRVALVFGRENSGLENEELDRCHALVRIPTGGQLSSLNLGAAVQILAYEILRANREGDNVPEAGGGELLPGAGHQEVPQHLMEGFYSHLNEALIEIGFYHPDRPKLLERRLRRLFNRVRPDRAELNILRGILTAAQKAARQNGP